MYSEIINEKIDVIIRYEALQKGFDKVCELIGKPPMILGREESRERLHYSVYYNETTRRKVAERFEKDIEDHQYVFEDTEGFSAVALSALCRQAIERRPLPIVPMKESSDRLLWLGPTFSVPVTRVLRRARSSLFPQA
jgi:hypothetical protein